MSSRTWRWHPDGRDEYETDAAMPDLPGLDALGEAAHAVAVANPDHHVTIAVVITEPEDTSD